MRIALKVDVDTLRGTLQGVPTLLRLFRRFQVRATFLFSLGPDHTGRALRRILRPGFLSKVRRTSVASHYGLKTLMYGVLLPGPDIARRAARVMRAAEAAGHEAGIHCYDHIKWQDFVARKGDDWTRREMERAAAAFEGVFERPARVHGAAGWQLNAHCLALEERMGFDYASDTRGDSAFYPLLDGVRSACPQIPTTLPTLDELIGWNGITEDDVPEHIFAASERELPQGQVYTLHAELEGMKLAPVMERLLTMWLDAGFEVHAMEDHCGTLDLGALPCREVVWGRVPGRSGYLALQGAVARDRR